MDIISLAISASNTATRAVRIANVASIDTTPGLPLLELSSDNITTNAVRLNSNSGDGRLTYLMERLTTHLHNFARETRLSTDEWETALKFLVDCGKKSDGRRNEFTILSDVLGLSLLVDAINHPKPPACTEGSVSGSFHTHDATTISNGSSMTLDPDGEPLLVVCSVKDSHGNALQGVKVDVWETNPTEHKDVPSEQCVIESEADGQFWFKAVKPASYPIPNDGPVGKLLQLLKRDHMRPAHMHFRLDKQGFDPLSTALFIRGDPYETCDPVFGSKQSLIVGLSKVDRDTAKQYDVQEGSWLLKHDFVLATEEETNKLRDRNAKVVTTNLGLKMRLVNHLPVLEVELPVPDLD